MKAGHPFLLKYFEVQHERSAMKVGTDAFVLGSWLPVGEEAEHILDVGTGCGIIALMLAQKTRANIDTIDIDKLSIDEAFLNFQKSPWKERLTAIHASIQAYNPVPDKKYDLIVSNPPFFTHSLLPDSERLKMAKHTINFPMETFIRKSVHLLVNNGFLAVILPMEESADFCKLAAHLGLSASRILNIYPKTGKPANRKVMVFSKNSVQNPIVQSLVIRDNAGKYTDDYKTLTRDFHAEGYI